MASPKPLSRLRNETCKSYFSTTSAPKSRVGFGHLSRSARTRRTGFQRDRPARYLCAFEDEQSVDRDEKGSTLATSRILCPHKWTSCSGLREHLLCRLYCTK